MDSRTYIPYQTPRKQEYFTAMERIGSEIDSERRPQKDFHRDRNDSEENVTFISESMTVTSADEEKLLLLNKNTELRRLNKELMKLNQEWDQIYRSTTTGLQQAVGCLQQEVVALKQHTERLSMKLDHEQNRREYYEQTLLQELKKNQHLQEYIRHVESKLHQNSTGCNNSEQKNIANGELIMPPNESEEIIDTESLPHRITYNGHSADIWALPIQKSRVSEAPIQKNSKFPSQHSKPRSLILRGSGKEVTELKEQLQAMKCQTEIYEADYQTEHQDRQKIKAENEKLRRKEEDMRQQMLLLQEQLKVYEDDFRKERSDKQILQRLLKNKTTPKDPVLVHRCNNSNSEIPVAALLNPQASVSRHSSSKACNRQGQRHDECPKCHHLREEELESTSFPLAYK